MSDKTSIEAETVKADNDRFVLTPALRVLDDLAPLSGGQGVSDMDTPPEQTVATVALDNISEEQTEPETEDVAETEPENSPAYDAMAYAWNEELARVSADRQEPGADRISNVLPRPENSLELRIAELEEAVAQTADEWEPDGIEPEIAKPPRHHIFEIVDNTIIADADQDDLDDQDHGKDLDELDRELDEIAGDSDEDIIEENSVDTVEEDIEATDNVTPMFTRSGEQVGEPYLLSKIIPNTGQDQAPVTDDTPSFRHTSPAETEPPEPASVIVDNDDVFLDVEALRNMISEVVREELRGKMGESITRNLRRMVRQEIEVALLPNEGD